MDQGFHFWHMQLSLCLQQSIIKLAPPAWKLQLPLSVSAYVIFVAPPSKVCRLGCPEVMLCSHSVLGDTTRPSDGRVLPTHPRSLPASVKKNDISLDHKKSVFLRSFLPSERPIQTDRPEPAGPGRPPLNALHVRAQTLMFPGRESSLSPLMCMCSNVLPVQFYRFWKSANFPCIYSAETS